MGRNKRLALAFLKSIAAWTDGSHQHAEAVPQLAPRSWPPSAAMTKFLGLLAETPYQWRLKKGAIRTGNVREDCPITGVARHLTGWYYGTTEWRAEARKFGLPEAEAKLVVSAADNGQGHIPQLRALLLAATVNRPAAPSLAAPTPDQMDAAIAALLTQGSVPAEGEREEELVPA